MLGGCLDFTRSCVLAVKQRGDALVGSLREQQCCGAGGRRDGASRGAAASQRPGKSRRHRAPALEGSLKAAAYANINSGLPGRGSHVPAFGKRPSCKEGFPPRWPYGKMCVFAHMLNLNKSKFSPTSEEPSSANSWGGAAASEKAAAARAGGTSEPDRRRLKDPGQRHPRRRFTKKNGEGRSSSASPLSAALLLGDPRAGERERAGGGFPDGSRSASSPPASPIPPSPHPAAVAASSGGGSGKSQRSAGSPPRAASSRALGYPCAVSGVTQTSRNTPLSLQGVRNPQGSVGAIWFIDY